MDAWNWLPVKIGDAYERLGGLLGDAWKRLSGSGYAWERLTSRITAVVYGDSAVLFLLAGYSEPSVSEMSGSSGIANAVFGASCFYNSIGDGSKITTEVVDGTGITIRIQGGSEVIEE